MHNMGFLSVFLQYKTPDGGAPEALYSKYIHIKGI